MFYLFEKKKLLVALAAAAAIGLTGCGGGGSSSGGSSSGGGGNPAPQPSTPEPENTVPDYFKAINFDPEVTGYTGRGVNLAVYDTGILIDHSEFEGRISQFSGSFASEFSTIGAETSPSWKLIDTQEFAADDHGVDAYTDAEQRRHGSVVTSIAAGKTTGVARSATILAYDVVYEKATDESSLKVTGIDPAGGFVDATAAHLHIAEKGKTQLDPSISLDIDFASISISYAHAYPIGAMNAESVIAKIKSDTDTALVVSGGNDQTSLTDSHAGPGLYDAIAKNSNFKDIIIMVGAMDQKGEAVWTGSNTPGTNSDIQDRFIMAPGVGITGADYSDPNGFITETGTSMSTPMVAGAAALVKEKFPQLSNRQVLQVLLDTANQNIPDYDVTIHGQGLLDVGAALNVDPYLYTTP